MQDHLAETGPHIQPESLTAIDKMLSEWQAEIDARKSEVLTPKDMALIGVSGALGVSIIINLINGLSNLPQ